MRLRPPRLFFLYVAVAALAAVPVHAREPAVTGSGQGIGIELAAIDRTLEVGDSRATGQASLGGFYVYLQRGAAFRVEARLLGGSLDYSSDVGSRSDSALFGDARMTWGTSTGVRTRLYAGVGARGLAAGSPFGDGDGVSTGVYVPVGVAKAGSLDAGWSVLLTVEAQFLAAGTEEIDDIPGAGDGEFDRTGGWGAAFSMRFRKPGAGIAIEPYVHHADPSSSETESVGGADIRVEEVEDTQLGTRLIWTF